MDTKLTTALDKLRESYTEGLIDQGEFYAAAVAALDDWFRSVLDGGDHNA